MAAPKEIDALDAAVRALRSRDRSSAELEARLERRGVGEADRAQALETLERLGYVDDDRFARARARQLAERGSGDALIRHDLEARGLPPGLVAAALGELEPERERARRVIAARGGTAKTARYLASRGFGEDAVADLVAQDG